MELSPQELLAEETGLESLVVDNSTTAEVKISNRKFMYLSMYAPIEGAFAQPFKGYQLRFNLLRGKLKERTPGEDILIRESYCTHEELTDEVKQKIIDHFGEFIPELEMIDIYVGESYDRTSYGPDANENWRNPHQSSIWGSIAILTKDPEVEPVRPYILPFKQALETLQVD
jgi:hypothetical protein